MNKKPDPPPEAWRNRYKPGDTTLDTCGYCEYCVGLVDKYGCTLEGQCTLGKSTEAIVYWTSECTIKTCSKNELKFIMSFIAKKVEVYKDMIEQSKLDIEKLKTMIPDAINLPTLPHERPLNYFNIDDTIAVWIEHNEQWYFGKVIDGPKHHEGAVSYNLNEYKPIAKEVLACGAKVPLILLKEEFNYFSQYPDKYNLWCDRSYNFDFNGRILEPISI